MRRHPSLAQFRGTELPGRPVADDPCRLISGNIIQIAVHRVDSRIGKSIGNFFQHSVLRKEVVRVQKADDIASRPGDTFVQGIIDAFVGCTEHKETRMPVRLDSGKRVVGRGTVDDEMLDIGIGLPCNGIDGLTDHGGAIVDRSDDGDLWWHLARLLEDCCCRNAQGAT